MAVTLRAIIKAISLYCIMRIKSMNDRAKNRITQGKTRLFPGL